ncbi:MAG: DUF3127 domain-containing protein [Bacteroidales bacterium]
MEIKGKIILINPIFTGESKNGTWKKQDFVIEIDSQYPKKICFCLWGDKISKLDAIVGDIVNVSFDIESKESNGRWFTEARAWLIKKESNDNNSVQDSTLSNDLPIIEEDDILPF